MKIELESSAPIILFVYNRPLHTERAIEALLKASNSENFDLFIYSDGPKENLNELEKENINKVKEIIHKVTGFKSITIFDAKKNKGLAKSIIDGVSDQIGQYGKAIVLEDDVIVGKYFLDYMNRALNLYAKQERVFMISAYAFNLPFIKKRKSAYFLPGGSTQAWATWKSSWDQIDFKAKGYEELKTDRKKRFRFNLHGSMNYSEMLVKQMESNDSSISSWAIRFRWSVFQANGLTLFPPKNLINNIGWDGSGRHCDTENPYKDNVSDNDFQVQNYPKVIKSSRTDYVRLIYFFYRLKISDFLKNKFK